MDDLDPNSRAFLDKALPSAWPQPDVEQRVLTKLRARLAPGPSGDGSSGESPNSAPNPDANPSSSPTEQGPGVRAQQAHGPAVASTATGLSKLAASLTIVGVATAIVAGIAWKGEPEAPSSQPQQVAEKSPTPPSSNRSPPSTPVHTILEKPNTRIEPTKNTRTDKRPPPPRVLERPRPSTAEPSRADDATLDAETALIVAANAALARDDAQAVLDLVERHARDFPKGLLHHERDALRCMALCKLRDPRAQAAYTAFARNRPASSHLNRVKALCRALEK
ncbi:MAG: hypothetical protein ACPG4T_11810 [Nannocystaceae bacterium]